MGWETLEGRQMGFIGRVTRKFRVSEWGEVAEANLEEHENMAGCAILDDRHLPRAKQCSRFYLDNRTI